LLQSGVKTSLTFPKRLDLNIQSLTPGFENAASFFRELIERNNELQRRGTRNEFEESGDVVGGSESDREIGVVDA
jgi:hypothetical protein